ncbi:MAG: alpha/beta hydrolase [Hyphomicrobiales bacterium]|nr:alpha/beta hydrolase [Hyphomicrobiales bacterium]
MNNQDSSRLENIALKIKELSKNNPWDSLCFIYSQDYRTNKKGGKLPPFASGQMIPEFEAALEALDTEVPLIIGGKSMGGRIASMIADGLLQTKRISGLLCIGYPFHPIGKPDKLRTDHLRDLQTPTLICQGTRDPFGTAEEVAAYDPSGAIEITWLEDGDHDLKPRKRISGFTHADHMQSMAASVSAWVDGL